MKYINESKIKLKNFSNMDEWNISDVQYDQIVKNGIKDVSLVKHFQNVFKEELGLSIVGIDRMKFLGEHLDVLNEGPHEYRITLGTETTESDIISSYYDYDTIEETIDYLNENGDSPEEIEKIVKEIKKDIEDNVGEAKEVDQQLTFSVFSDKLLPPTQYATQLLLSVKAIKYLGDLISSGMFEYVIGGSLDRNDMMGSPELITNFYNKRGFKVTNEKVDNVLSTPYRLYKDNVFFHELKDYIQTHTKVDYNNFFKKLYNV